MIRGKTYEVNIWIGLNPGYDIEPERMKEKYPIEKVKSICEKFCEKGLCVTVTKTQFIYTGGKEDGVCIGLINYPRFPSSNHNVYMNAVELAYILMEELKQFRCTVIDSEETNVLENPNMPSKYKDKD